MIILGKNTLRSINPAAGARWISHHLDRLRHIPHDDRPHGNHGMRSHSHAVAEQCSNADKSPFSNNHMSRNHSLCFYTDMFANVNIMRYHRMICNTNIILNHRMIFNGSPWENKNAFAYMCIRTDKCALRQNRCKRIPCLLHSAIQILPKCRFPLRNNDICLRRRISFAK